MQKLHYPLIEVFEIIKEQLALQAEERQNQLILDVEDHVMVNADYDRLIQILVNITKNSIQFTTNGTVWLRGREDYKETVIEVEDTGIGIDENDIENIWDRFIKRIYHGQTHLTENTGWGCRSSDSSSPFTTAR